MRLQKCNQNKAEKGRMWKSNRRRVRLFQFVPNTDYNPA